MVARKMLAREFTIEVETAVADTFVAIGGLITWGQSPGKVDAVTTDFDSAGNAEHMPAERSLQLTFEGRYLEDSADGARDAGQERVETLADDVGPLAATSRMRVTSAGGNIKTYTGSFEVTGPGGGSNDASGWSFTLTRSGATVSS